VWILVEVYHLIIIWRAVALYGFRVIYSIGLLIIIGITIIRLIQLEPVIPTKVNNNQILSPTLNQKNDSLTSLVIKPIVESVRNQIIFEGLFWFLLWLLFFMLVPAGLLPLKKFKMFSLEFEIGVKEAAAIEKISQNSSKALTMANYVSEDSIIRFFQEFSNEGEVHYRQALEFYLKDLVKGYKEEFEANIHYEIFSINECPKRYNSIVKESIQTKSAAVLNKLENENPLHENWLVFTVADENIVTVFGSRLTPFDAMDQYLIMFLHHFVYRIMENRNYAMAINEIAEQDDDGQVG
jgi:hypothetical protein